MRLKILSSSSQGNCYILENDTEALIIECGVKFSRIKKALCFDLSKIVGCVCSHRHADHSKGVTEFINNAIPVLASEDVFTSKGIPLSNPFVKVILEEHGYKMGNFKILPVSVNHDVPCHLFLLDHPESGKVLFMTDTFMSEHTFPGLNHIIIEANFADDILEENIRNGSVHPSMRPRLMQTHMEIKTCINVLKASDTTNVINIVLCHLSDGNSDEERFIREVREATGKQVFAARKGLEVEFNINPY